LASRSFFRRQHIQRDRGRRAGRHDPFNAVGNRNDAAGRIFDLGCRDRRGDDRKDSKNN
jgi:hypothetical protein